MFLWSVFSRIQTYIELISVFSRNAGKYGPEKLRIRTLFTSSKSLKPACFLKGY